MARPSRPASGYKRLTICLSKIGPPHKLDGQIMKMAADLRRMVHERKADFIRNRMLGTTASEATRAKLSKALKGRVLSAEHIAKSAAAQRGRKRSPAARANISKGILEYHARLKAEA